MAPKHPIRMVSRKTGLSSHLIRAWERRYKAVVPERSESGQRLYNDSDIERLKKLKAAVDSGESIAQVAALNDEELDLLIKSIEGTSMAGVIADSEKNDALSNSPEEYLNQCIDAIVALDTEQLEYALMNATSDLSRPVLMEQVMEPLMNRIGEMWREGKLKVAHEHIASAVVRTFLGNLSRAYRPIESAPVVVFTTPTGQLHEFGALISSIIASADGWNAFYLGPDSPADDIANVVRSKNARAVGLSIIYPSDDPRVTSELRTLRRLIGSEIPILIGGRSASNYLGIIKEIGAYLIPDVKELRGKLQEIRRSHSTI